jgi:hypothetical protein
MIPGTDLLFRRQAMKPTPMKPKMIIAQVDGSTPERRTVCLLRPTLWRHWKRDRVFALPARKKLPSTRGSLVGISWSYWERPWAKATTQSTCKHWRKHLSRGDQSEEFDTLCRIDEIYVRHRCVVRNCNHCICYVSPADRRDPRSKGGDRGAAPLE